MMRTHWIVPTRPARASSSRTPARSFTNFDRLFSDWRDSVPTAAGGFAPVVDVETTDAEVRLSAELPGLEDKDFEVTLDGDVLSIQGEKRSERESESDGATLRERTHGKFERRFRLAFEADPASLSATFRNGVLTVVVPKPEEEQPQVRTIPVSTD